MMRTTMKTATGTGVTVATTTLGDGITIAMTANAWTRHSNQGRFALSMSAMAIVMMQTTTKTVIGMEVTVVATMAMSGIVTAMTAYVWTQSQFAQFTLETVSVTMKTTMLIANGTVATVAIIM